MYPAGSAMATPTGPSGFPGATLKYRRIPALMRALLATGVMGVHAGACLGAYAVAAVLFTLAFLVAGESYATTTIAILPGMPGEQAGLKDGDTITRVDGETITDWEQMHNAIKRRPGQPMQVEIRRNDQGQTLEVTPNGEGRIGVKPVMAARPMGLGRALALAGRP